MNIPLGERIGTAPDKLERQAGTAAKKARGAAGGGGVKKAATAGAGAAAKARKPREKKSPAGSPSKKAGKKGVSQRCDSCASVI